MSDVSPFAPPQASAPRASQDTRPIAILVLGALGLVMCQVLGGVAWGLAVQYERDCAAQGVKPDQMATVGKILGMVGVGIFAVMMLSMVLALLAYVAFFVLWMVMALLMVLLSAARAVAG